MTWIHTQSERFFIGIYGPLTSINLSNAQKINFTGKGYLDY